MIRDVWTVMAKECKELKALLGTKGGILRTLIMVGIMGIFVPMQMGAPWFNSPVAVFITSWTALFLVSAVIADSFAGERERHTLESLLATPLSDTAILFGKAGAAVAYGWGLSLASLLVAMVALNMMGGEERFLCYSFEVGFGAGVTSFLTAWLAAGVGVLVSLRAATVRAAYQALSISIMLILFVPLFGIQLLPAEWRRSIAEALQVADLKRVAVLVLGGLVVVDAVVLGAAIKRFRRARLILD